MKLVVSILLFLFCVNVYAQKEHVVKKAISSSYLVRIPNVSSGSGVAFMHYAKGTLILTNDHVCQSTRGIHPNSFDPRSSQKMPINTLKIYLESADEESYEAVVLKTTDVDLQEEGKDTSDLCILYTKHLLPISSLGEANPAPGDHLFAVSAPGGIFPMVSQGFAGPYVYLPQTNLKQFLVSSIYINGGSSGGGVFDPQGKIVGIVFSKRSAARDGSYLASGIVPLRQVIEFTEKFLEERASSEMQIVGGLEL